MNLDDLPTDLPNGPEYEYVSHAHPLYGGVWVSNSSSRGDRELHEATAVRHPAHLVEIGRCDWGAIDHRQWRIAIEGCVAPCRVVVDLELGQLSFQVTGIPERDLVEKFPPNRPDESLDKWV